MLESVEERHRHRYEINPKYVEELEKAGLRFVGHSTDNTRMEIMELPLSGKNTLLGLPLSCVKGYVYQSPFSLTWHQV